VVRAPQRSQSRRLHLARVNRWLWAWLSRVWSGWRTAVVIVKSEAVVARVPSRISLALDVESRRRAERPPIALNVRAHGSDDAAGQSTLGRTPHPWRAPEDGRAVSQATVAKYLARTATPSSQSWRSFWPTRSAHRGRRLLLRADCDLPTGLRAGDGHSMSSAETGTSEHSVERLQSGCQGSQTSCGRCAVINTELVENVFEMFLHSSAAHFENRRGLCVCFPVRDPGQHLALARCQAKSSSAGVLTRHALMHDQRAGRVGPPGGNFDYDIVLLLSQPRGCRRAVDVTAGGFGFG
jgi:hypothetical protein